MSKAVIFDMDGVIVDSETVWEKQDTGFFGAEIKEQIKDRILGSTIKTIYGLAVEHGLAMTETEFFRRYNEIASKVYAESTMTKDVETTLQTLKGLGYKIGLVTSSPRLWINWVLPRIKNREVFDYVLSIGDTPELHSKPAPDGYLRAMEVLGVTPQETTIVEDSNNGIKSAKASGAHSVGFRQHHAPGYELQGADAYVDTMRELEDYMKAKYR